MALTLTELVREVGTHRTFYGVIQTVAVPRTAYRNGKGSRAVLHIMDETRSGTEAVVLYILDPRPIGAGYYPDLQRFHVLRAVHVSVEQDRFDLSVLDARVFSADSVEVVDPMRMEGNLSLLAGDRRALALAAWIRADKTFLAATARQACILTSMAPDTQSTSTPWPSSSMTSSSTQSTSTPWPNSSMASCSTQSTSTSWPSSSMTSSSTQSTSTPWPSSSMASCSTQSTSTHLVGTQSTGPSLSRISLTDQSPFSSSSTEIGLKLHQFGVRTKGIPTLDSLEKGKQQPLLLGFITKLVKARSVMRKAHAVVLLCDDSPREVWLNVFESDLAEPFPQFPPFHLLLARNAHVSTFNGRVEANVSTVQDVLVLDPRKAVRLEGRLGALAWHAEAQREIQLILDQGLVLDLDPDLDQAMGDQGVPNGQAPEPPSGFTLLSQLTLGDNRSVYGIVVGVEPEDLEQNGFIE